jgi:hypothetical protein
MARHSNSASFASFPGSAWERTVFAAPPLFFAHLAVLLLLRKLKGSIQLNRLTAHSLTKHRLNDPRRSSTHGGGAAKAMRSLAEPGIELLSLPLALFPLFSNLLSKVVLAPDSRTRSKHISSIHMPVMQSAC